MARIMLCLIGVLLVAASSVKGQDNNDDTGAVDPNSYEIQKFKSIMENAMKLEKKNDYFVYAIHKAKKQMLVDEVKYIMDVTFRPKFVFLPDLRCNVNVLVQIPNSRGIIVDIKDCRIEWSKI